MDKLLIHGGHRLRGEVAVSGAKNAALPILCASLLVPGPVRVSNVPMLQDVRTTLALLGRMGVRSEMTAGEVTLDASELTHLEASYDLVKTMRASILVLGPLVARFGEARVSLPGGCAIGQRPVDQHIKGLQLLGAQIDIEHGYVVARASRLKGARIVTDMVTVTGTENLMMAATLAEGETVIENAAREPEVVDLARALIALGARIEGAGTDRIVVHGVPTLHGGEVQVMFGGAINTTTLVKSGKLRALAVAGDRRAKALPDVPTVAEQGFPGFAASTWFGLFAPARQSSDALARLAAEVPRAMADPELKARLATLSLTDPGLAGPAAADFVRREAQIWAEVVKTSGATAD